MPMESEPKPDTTKAILVALINDLPDYHPHLLPTIEQYKLLVRDFHHAQQLLRPVRPPVRRRPPPTGLVAAFLLPWIPLAAFAIL